MIVGIICLKNVIAFFSPSTLQLVSVTIGNFFKQIVIIIIAFVVSLLILLKSKLKNLKYTKYIVFISIFIIFAFFLINFKRISNLNKDNLPFAECYKVDEPWECILDKKTENSDYKEFREIRYVDLNKINLNEYNEYTVIPVIGGVQISLVNEVKNREMDFFKFLDKKSFSDYLFEFDKNKKILFYCYHGTYSSVIAFHAFSLGYNAYYSDLEKLTNDKIINSSLITQQKNSIIILPESYKKNNYSLFISFTFGHGFEFGDIVTKFIKEAYSPIIVYMYNEDFIRKFNDAQESTKIKNEMLNSNILCVNDLECLMMQHFINSMNLSSKIKYIYKVDSRKIEEYEDEFKKLTKK